MSTSDWKAELRRRIQQIREKKASEKPRRQKINAQPVTQWGAAPAALPEEEAEAEPLAEITDEVAPSFKPSAFNETAAESGRPVRAELETNESSQALVESLKGLNQVEESKAEPLPPETLFPVEPLFTVEDEDEVVETLTAGSREQAQSAAAPAASDLKAAMDHYTPLEHDIQTAAEEEIVRGEAPRAEISEEIPYSRNLRRVLSAAVDLALIALAEAAILMVASFLLGVGATKLLSVSLLPLAAMFLILHFVYYTLFTALTGQTLGKIVFRLRVAPDNNGRAVGIFRAIARWIVGAISILPLAAGYLWMYSRSDGCSWHDILLRMKVKNFKP